jgi:hypothetical protein
MSNTMKGKCFCSLVCFNEPEKYCTALTDHEDFRLCVCTYIRKKQYNSFRIKFTLCGTHQSQEHWFYIVNRRKQ